VKTLATKTRKAKLEEELKEIQDAKEIFSKEKVYIQND